MFRIFVLLEEQKYIKMVSLIFLFQTLKEKFWYTTANRYH